MSPAGSPDESTADRADAASDRDLLTRFVLRQDERAFAEIVGRYGGLVLGVCRRVLSDTHSAEDAFQATFLVLARSARKIRKRRSLAAWLHGVALRVSKRALAVQKRRREKPCEAPDVTVDPLAEISALYEQQMLDEQLLHLPEKYREPLVLHYLQGQSQQQVAEQLGLSVTALEGRLRRGRHELRRRLVRTGVGLGAALTAAHVASSTVSAGSASLQPLIAATAKAAVAHAASQAVTTLVSQEAASLAGKELAMIAASKVATTVGLSSAAVALVLVGIGAAGPGDSQSAGGGSDSSAVIAGDVFGSTTDGGGDSILLADAIDVGAPGAGQQTSEQVEIKLLREQIVDLQRSLDTSRQFAPPDLKPRDGRTAMIEAVLDATTKMEFPANPLKDVADYLAEIHKIPILIDVDTLSEAGVAPDVEISLVIQDITLRNALELLLDGIGGVKLDYVIEHQVLKITTREKADQTLDTRVYSLRALENSGFDSYSVANVIRKTIEPASWAHIEIVPEKGEAGMEGMMGMMAGGMPMAGMGSGIGVGDLGAMQINRTQSSGLGTIEALPGCLVITQCQRVHRAVADLLAQLKAQAVEVESGTENPAHAAIRQALDAPTSVEYAGVPLDTVIGEFANRFGINFVIDNGALERAGISLHVPVTVATQGISLRSVLTLILKQIGKGQLTFEMDDQVIKITTVEQAGRIGGASGELDSGRDGPQPASGNPFNRRSGGIGPSSTGGAGGPGDADGAQVQEVTVDAAAFSATPI